MAMQQLKVGAIKGAALVTICFSSLTQGPQLLILSAPTTALKLNNNLAVSCNLIIPAMWGRSIFMDGGGREGDAEGETREADQETGGEVNRRANEYVIRRSANA